MKKISTNILPVIAIAFLLLPVYSFTKDHAAFSQARWEKLGQRKVNFKADKDEIGVGKYEGFFNALRLKVTRGSITMKKMVVHFHNGEEREVELRENFTDGSTSRVIDLPANIRLIDKVVFWYESSSVAGNKPIIELWGRH